jgi:hypothetical protein
MVALQKDKLGAAQALAVEQKFDDVVCRRSAVNIVADEHHCVAAHGLDRAKHHTQLIGASVNIADCEQAARPRSPM